MQINAYQLFGASVERFLMPKIAELVRSVGTGGLELGRSVGQRAFEIEVSFTILFVVNASSYIRCPTLRPSSKLPVPTLRTSSAIFIVRRDVFLYCWAWRIY